MSKPFFSIIVPIYNTAREYVECCIDSLLRQTMPDIEIILIDDGSRAECAAMCDEFASDNRVQVIHQINRGVSAARNAGIAAACADWIMFVDADDWLQLNACEILQEALQDGADDLLMFRMVREDKNNSAPLQYGLELDRTYNLSTTEDRETLYRRVIGICPPQMAPLYYSCDKVYSREFLLKNDLSYPVGLAKSEDKVFIAHCLERARTFRQIDRLLYHYRMNDESVCHRYSANMDAQRVILVEKLTPLVKRLNQELADKMGDSSYCCLQRDYERYLFGVVTEVLYLKFYHKDNPHKRSRRKEARHFVLTEPFRSIIQNMAYSNLSLFTKIKKFLLQHGCVSLFFVTHHYLLHLLPRIKAELRFSKP